MADVDKDTVLRIYNLLVANDGAQAIKLVRAAAYSGDIDVLKIVLEKHGKDAFVGKVSGRRIDALERAATGNQVAIMQWLIDAGACDGVHHEVATNGVRSAIFCRAASLAVENGSFSALDFIADKVPELQNLPLEEGAALVFKSKRTDFAIGSERLKKDGGLKFREVRLYGLMTFTISVAEKFKRDTSAMLARFEARLAGGRIPTPQEMKMAVQLGNAGCFKLMLEAGGLIAPNDLSSELGSSGRAATMLAVLNEHLETSKKKFHEVFCTNDTPPKPLLHGSFVARHNLDQPRSVSFLGDIADVLRKARAWSADSMAVSLGVEVDSQQLADEVVRFSKLVSPTVLSPEMFARAVAADSVAMVERLVAEGVDPTKIPVYQPRQKGEDEKAIAPIHRCRSGEMVRLLHKYGVDVNTPLTHVLRSQGSVTIEGNLFTLLSTRGPWIPDMVHAIAECGGDVNGKYSGRTVNSLLGIPTADFKEAVRSAKSSVAVSTAVDVNAIADETAEATPPGRARGLSPI